MQQDSSSSENEEKQDKPEEGRTFQRKVVPRLPALWLRLDPDMN